MRPFRSIGELEVILAGRTGVEASVFLDRILMPRLYMGLGLRKFSYNLNIFEAMMSEILKTFLRMIPMGGRVSVF